MKKVLVLSLVLIMALCGSALAAVNFSGEFETVVENDGEDFTNGYKIKPSIKINIKATAGDDDNWSLDAESSIEGDKFKLGKYLLELNDNYFDLYFWGNGRELSDKGTTLSLFKAAKKADKVNRARLVVDYIEPVTLTTDFTPGAFYVFADAKVADVDLGAAYKATGENIIKDGGHSVGVWGKTSIDMFTLQGDVGVTLGDELAPAFAVKVGADITDAVNAYIQYKNADDKFAGDLTAGTNELKVGAEYEETALKVTATVTQGLADGITKKDNTIELGTTYRMSETVAHKNLFHKDHWFKNDAPAFGASTKIAALGLDNIKLDAAAPVMEDVVWVKGNVTYKGQNDDETDLVANVEGRVVASDKLVLKPSVNYETVGTVIKVGSIAEYKIGTSSTQLNLDVNKTFAKDDSKEKEVVKASVKVKF